MCLSRRDYPSTEPPTCLTQLAWDSICMTAVSSTTCDPEDGSRWVHPDRSGYQGSKSKFWPPTARGTIASVFKMAMPTLVIAPVAKVISLHLILKAQTFCIINHAAASAIPPVGVAIFVIQTRCWLPVMYSQVNSTLTLPPNCTSSTSTSSSSNPTNSPPGSSTSIQIRPLYTPLCVAFVFIGIALLSKV